MHINGLAMFDPLIKAAQRLSGDVGVIYYEELDMLIFFIDTDNGLTVVHKILLTDKSNYTEDPIAYHIPQIKKGLRTLKRMRDRHKEDYRKLTGGAKLKKGFQF